MKQLGELAEIDEPSTVTKTCGGVKKAVLYKKYERIMSHTARRSMISNGILAWITTNQMMLISGYKSPRVFNSYVRITPNQNAIALSEHVFFQWNLGSFIKIGLNILSLFILT